MKRDSSYAAKQGWLLAELTVAMGILVLTASSLVVLITKEQQVFRQSYYRAVAMEIVDGELEILLSGEYRSFAPGRHPYRVAADSARNLPAGRFLLERREQSVVLQYVPDKPGRGARVGREVRLPP
jgi:hypothetical protein